MLYKWTSWKKHGTKYVPAKIEVLDEVKNTWKQVDLNEAQAVIAERGFMLMLGEFGEVDYYFVQS